MLSKVDGEMEESVLTPSDVNGKASKIQSPAGDKLLLSKTDGEVKEPALTVGDITVKALKK